MNVVAPDGTPIATVDAGTGAPVVLVAGSSYDAAACGGVVALLQDRFACFAMDRRGRGASGDGPAFSIEAEIEDVKAVVDAVGEPVTLFGHSYGSLCALGATLLGADVARLVLYEPPLMLDGPVPDAVLDEADAALAEDDPRAALLILLRDVVRISDDELAFVGALPDEFFETFAPTAIREIGAVSDRDPDPARYASVSVPTRFLLGTESPSHIVNATDALVAALPRTEVVTLEGQGHNAILSAPNLVADAIAGFCG